MLQLSFRGENLTHFIYATYLFVLVYLFLLKRENLSLSRRLTFLRKRVTRSSFVDNLTGLYNYRYFARRIQENVGRIQDKKGLPFSLIKLDIELFQNINIIYGNTVGDNILFEFSRFLEKFVRRSDIVFRLEGDEFAILLNFTPQPEALKIARRIKRDLKVHGFGNFRSITDKIVLNTSLAVVSYPQDSSCEIGLLSLADLSLKRSRQLGGKIVTPRELNSFTKNININNNYSLNDLTQRIASLEDMLGRNILESVIAFANTIRAKDSYTAEHVAKTVRIAVKIAGELSLDEERIDIIKYAAFLHDLGKVGISEAILQKEGPLTILEFEEIKKHPLIGGEILRPLHEVSQIIPPIIYHHERIDGSGYPYGLERNNIPLEAKIIAIADSYQALTSERPYRRAFSHKKALKIIEQEIGSHFDLAVAKAFMRIIR